MKSLALTLFALCCMLHMQAQPVADLLVRGRVLDEQQSPVEFANVILKRTTDSLLIKGTITEPDGAFEILDVDPGEYFIQISLIGFGQMKTSSFELNTNQSALDLGTLTLAQEATTLNEVTVRSQKPFIERQLDRLVVNVENSIVSAGASAFEVLERSPGVVIDQNDNISIRGKQGVIIMMDGKPAQLSSSDLANMLRGMSSSTIEKIEIITNPSAKYDAAGNAGIINIVMKKDKRQGMNGSANVSIGNNRYWRGDAGFNLNYRNKNWNLFGNYSYTNMTRWSNISTFRNFRLGGEILNSLDQYNELEYPTNTHVARVGADYSIGNRTTIGFLANGLTNEIEQLGNSETLILDENRQRTGSFFTGNDTQESSYNYSLNTNFRHVFDSLGRELTVDLDYAYYDNLSDQFFLTENKDAEQNKISESIFVGDMDGLLDIYAVKADYSHPISKTLKLEAGVKSSWVKSDNDLTFYDRINGEDIYNAGWSNHFIYKENINAGYLNYRQEFNEKWSMQLGLRGEQTIADGIQVTTDSAFNRNYFQLFPSFFVQWNISENHGLNYSMSRRIDRPNYQQLNPFRSFVDRTTYRAGNPFLLPQLSYSFELSHIFKQRFSTTFSYSITDEVLANVLQQLFEEQVSIYTFVNLAKQEYYGISLSASFNPTKWWNTSTTFNGYYSRFTGNIYDTDLDNAAPTFFVNSINRFTLPLGISAEMNLFYQHEQAYALATIQPIWQLSVGFQKRILQDKGSLRLNFNDIFWQGWPRGATVFANIDESFISRRSTRTAMLTFSYSFGKRTVPQARRRSTGAEEEMRRARSNN